MDAAQISRLHDEELTPPARAGRDDALGARVASRRAAALAPPRGRPDADPGRGRPLLEGVHQPDRARQDAPDRRDDRLARRHSSASTPRSSAAASRPTSAAGSRRCSRGPRRCPSRTGTPRRSSSSPRPGATSARPARPSSRFARSRARPGRRCQEGDAREAVELLQVARELAEGPQFSDVDRADILFRLGVCRYKLSSIATAASLFDEALALADASGLPCDLLRADILGWRSRCRRRQRDFEAAREDVEAALELARGADDRRVVANTYFQASLVAERMGHWVVSRNYAQQAKAIYQELNDERNVGRLMLNLGGLQLLLGKPEQAIEHLKASFALAVEADSQPDAAQALGSLAAVHLQLADYEAADENARKALALLEGRDDFLDEVGQSHLVLGRVAARARPPRRGRGVLPGCRRGVRADGVRRAQGGGVGRAGRPCEPSWRRSRGSASVPERRRGAPGHPLLRKEARQCAQPDCSCCWRISH